MSFLSRFLNVKAEGGFFAHTVEVVEDTKPLVRFKLHAFAAEPAEMCNQICAHTSKVCSCVLHIFLIDRDRHILILHDSVCSSSLFEQHFIVFLTVLVQLISRLWNQDCFLKVQSIQAAIVDCDFCRCAGIKRIKQLRVFKEHRFLILTACYGVVYIRKLKGLGKLVLSHLKDTVIIDGGNGDHILNALRHDKLFLVLFE